MFTPLATGMSNMDTITPAPLLGTDQRYMISTQGNSVSRQVTEEILPENETGDFD